MKSALIKSLASASCALIASPVLQAEEAHTIGDWDVSAAFLFYSEPDRVQALEPVVNARKLLDTDEFINVKLTFDTLTGASASGAAPSTQAQTFTRPSGNDSYVISSRDVALDDTFHDTRLALALNWSRPAFWDTQSELGVAVSREFDYQSIGASASFAKGINNNNTTFSTGIALASDSINPVGGSPLPLSLMQAVGEVANRQSDSENKTLVDFIAGVTQIIDADSLFQVNYSLSAADGYLNDAYKVISVLDPVTGAPLFGNTLEPNLPLEYYLQTIEEPVDKIGDLADLELAPDVDALMIRLLYDF